MSIRKTNPTWRRLRAALPAVAISALALAGCGSGGSDSGTESNGTAETGSSGTTIMVNDASGKTGVLATADGLTLYVSDQEDGKVLCKSSDCTAIWIPLTVNAGQTPTAPDQLTDRLGTVKRPAGEMQVTFDDKPLYTFSFDHEAGETGGNGESDSFDGTDFTWQTATADKSEVAPSTPAPTDGGGYDY